MKKIVYYVNQFYGQIGGEEAADQTPIVKEGSVGPAAEIGVSTIYTVLWNISAPGFSG